MIYVYRMWDFHNGYWTEDTSENRDRIDDSDDWFYMDAETYKEKVSLIPRSGNLAEY